MLNLLEKPEIKKYDAAPSDLPTVSIDGLEIFSTGKWNGDDYSQTDLQAMVDAFPKVGFEPTAKAGHEDGQDNPAKAKMVFGAPALGYVKNLYVKGNKLMADLRGIPAKFGALVKAGAYRRVSAEIYWNYKAHDGTVYPRVLKSVAFLGAEIPALPNLAAVEALYDKKPDGLLCAFDDAGNEIRVYHGDGLGMPNMMNPDMSIYLTNVRRMAKTDAGFEEDVPQDSEHCSMCEHFLPGYHACSLVEGWVDSEDVCDNYNGPEPPPPPQATAMSEGQVVQRVDYFIRKRGNQWCVLSEAGKTLGCHPTRAKAVAQLGAVEANKHSDDSATAAEYADMTIQKSGEQYCVMKGGMSMGCKATMDDAKKLMQTMMDKMKMSPTDKEKLKGGDSTKGMSEKGVWLSVEEMQEICPSCADTMREKKYAKVRIADEEGNLLPEFADKTGLYAGFSKGMCDEFGKGAGFRTRCMDTMKGKVGNEGAFCNSLKEWCFGSVTAGDKKKSQDDTNSARAYSGRSAGGIDMTEDEVNALLKRREDELKTQLFKEFEYRIHKAREEGKAEAVAENELLKEDIRKLQLEKRSERIEHWIKQMKETGKLLPAEESKVRALREWIPDEGGELKHFAVKDGKTVEFRDTPAALFESLFQHRQSIFATYSKADDLDAEETAKEYSDPGQEVDRRAKVYISREAAKNNKVSYRDAVSKILNSDTALAAKYRQMQH